jgi:hypothetical protein
LYLAAKLKRLATCFAACFARTKKRARIDAVVLVKFGAERRLPPSRLLGSHGFSHGLEKPARNVSAS